jgi:predicted nucleic acid-binding protein
VIVVVADTSVYVSALVFGGVPRAALEKALKHPYRLAVSPAIRDELAETLHRKFGWPEERIKRAGTMLWADALWHAPVAV